jgi:hypothetical protein
MEPESESKNTIHINAEHNQPMFRSELEHKTKWPLLMTVLVIKLSPTQNVDFNSGRSLQLSA